VTGCDQDEAGDGDVIRALGEELRRARSGAGMTQADLVNLMPSEIHVQTLATYERGIRQCSIGRFIEICRALGVAAPDVLHLAMQKAQQEADLRIIGVQVDLHAIVRDKQPGLRPPLRQWARNRLTTDSSGSGIARLDWIAIQELATLVGLPSAELVQQLVRFTPHSIRRWS
jgi:transcriptional regulator with XRE-family HTH domain